LTPAAKAAVRELLGPGINLADASTWADEQREIPRAGPWHYVNVPITESRYDPKFCQRGGCIASKVEDFRRVLQDPAAGKAEKQQAIKFLIHFICDLHQPLHVGDTGSRGGNMIQVRFFNVGSNLHRVWDTQIMERHSESVKGWVDSLNTLADQTLAAEWAKGTPADWATESLQEAKAAYRVPGTETIIDPGTRLGDGYCRMAIPIIQEQLAKAGIRTAWILNNIFK